MADSPVPLCSVAAFTESSFGDLVAKWSEQAVSDLTIEATRICEGEAGNRRLAPFTITETTRADGIDPDEYPAGAAMPMPITGTIGWSEAMALGGNDLVRHCWVSQFPARYPDLWEFSGVSVTVTRSYAGTETLSQAQILDGPDNLGHLWFQIGTLVPLGSRIAVTYSGGYTVAIPADLVRACKLVCAWLAIGELNPGSTDHDPDKLYTDALLILANYHRS